MSSVQLFSLMYLRSSVQWAGKSACTKVRFLSHRLVVMLKYLPGGS
jgi:hypothetical protein